MKNGIRGGDIFRITGPRDPANPIKYSSVPTRYARLHDFMGGAEIQEQNQPVCAMPLSSEENLEARFNSGVNRTDMPSRWAPANVTRHLGYINMSLDAEIAGYMRNGGLPIMKKGL